jgi:hypothetical protein
MNWKRTLLAFAVMVVSAGACTVPVFRYALDRWGADSYRLVVPASVGRQPDVIRMLIPLRGNGAANIKIESGPDAAATDAQLLFGTMDAVPLWTGPLNAETLRALLESPARQELIKRLFAGESVVWVIVEGGKPEGKAEGDRIEKRLRYLEQVMELPPQDPNDPDSEIGPGPALKLKLTTLRISQQDPAEKLFCAMLAGKKCAQALANGEAFAAPVFGRGRVLNSFRVQDLDSPAIDDITMFLTGRCSCRVKDQSPGWDVLLKVDWETELQKMGVPQQSDAAGAAAPARPEVIRIEPGKR